MMWEVWAEGWEFGSWEAERVRAKLERAMSSERYVTREVTQVVHRLFAKLQTSPVLWKVYISFEIRVGEFGRAKVLLYQSLVFCP